jgi:hypothetical protein
LADLTIYFKACFESILLFKGAIIGLSLLGLLERELNKFLSFGRGDFDVRIRGGCCASSETSGVIPCWVSLSEFSFLSSNCSDSKDEEFYSPSE